MLTPSHLFQNKNEVTGVGLYIIKVQNHRNPRCYPMFLSEGSAYKKLQLYIKSCGGQKTISEKIKENFLPTRTKNHLYNLRTQETNSPETGQALSPLVLYRAHQLKVIVSLLCNPKTQLLKCANVPGRLLTSVHFNDFSVWRVFSKVVGDEIEASVSLPRAFPRH